MSFGPQLIVAFIAGVLLLGVVAVFPALAFALLVSISPLKVLAIRLSTGALVGYTFDMGVVVIAILAALVYRLRQPGSFGFPLPPRVIVAWITICILLWLLIPLSRDQYYGFKKALYFSVFDTCAMITLPLFLLSMREAQTLLRTVLVTGTIAALAVLVLGSATADYKGARYSIGHVNPLAFADLAGQALFIAISAIIARPGAKSIALNLVVVPICGLAVLMTGTRGPVFGVGLALPLLFWLYRRRINFQHAMLALIGLAIGIGTVAMAIDPERLRRFQGDLISQGFSGRFQMLAVTLRGIASSPIIGNGTGDTSYQMTGTVAAEVYPHNHVAEITNELGIVGLAAWLTLVISALRAGLQLGRPEWDGTLAKDVGVPFFVGAAYFMLITFKGGSYAHSYMVYFYIITTIVLSELRKRDLTAWHQHQEAAWALRHATRTRPI